MSDASPRKFRFNSENARAMSLRAWELRRKRAAEAKLNPEPMVLNDKPIGTNYALLSDEAKEELGLVIRQIERTMKVLDDEDYRYCEHCKRAGVEPHHRAQLLRAVDTLLDRKRILRGQALPGSHRPVTPKPARTRLAEPAQPTEIAPDPPA